jgi:hypothetical protein
MRFMMIIKSDDLAESGKLPDEKILTEMGAYNEQLIKAGAMLAGEGLKESARGKRVRLSRGKSAAEAKVTDGPFTEAKELVAGFWLIQAESKAAAVDWARKVPGETGEIELRQLYENEDFGAPPADDPPPPPRKPGTSRSMLILKGGKSTESGDLPAPEVMKKMDVFMGPLAANGTIVGGQGLKPSSKGAKVKQHGSARTIIDGPFTEAKELVAGYMIVQTATLDEAVDIAKGWLEVHAQLDHDEHEIEVRSIFELEDFPVSPEEKSGGWRDTEKTFRDGNS